MSEVIKVENISKRYGNITALENVSFNVGKGEVVGFLGPNGAGKTTTLRILTCFMPPDSGSVSIMGHNIFDNPLAIKKNIGYLPEVPPLYNDMTVSEYLKFVSVLKGGDQRGIEYAVQRCGVKEVMKRLIANLSKGFRQRVGIAQALVHNPQIVILDEPTIGLDPNQIIEIRNLIKEIGQEKTVLLSSHTLSEVQATCSRVIIINKGVVVAKGSLDELSRQVDSQAENLFTFKVVCSDLPEDYQGKLNVINGLVSVKPIDNVSFMVETHSNLTDEIALCCVSNGWKLLEISPQKNSLEDIFRELTRSQEADSAK